MKGITSLVEFPKEGAFNVSILNFVVTWFNLCIDPITGKSNLTDQNKVLRS